MRVQRDKGTGPIFKSLLIKRLGSNRYLSFGRYGGKTGLFLRPPQRWERTKRSISAETFLCGGRAHRSSNRTLPAGTALPGGL